MVCAFPIHLFVMARMTVAMDQMNKTVEVKNVSCVTPFLLCSCCIFLKVQVPCVSMWPPPCTDELLRSSATVGNLGEMGEPDIFT